MIVASLTAAAAAYPFQNASLSFDARAADLIDRLSLHEKVGMLYMNSTMAFGNDTVVGKAGDLPSTRVERLGVPMFNWMGQGSIYRGAANGCNLNCCSGNVPPGNCSLIDGVATQFPQGTGWASTWNLELTFRAGVAISDESMALNHHFPRKTVDYRTGASSVVNIVPPLGGGDLPGL